MHFRLAIVGHASSVKEIEQIVAESFDNVETHGITLSRDEMAESATHELEALLPRLDGVLYTRSDPYKLVVSRLDHSSVPARYVETGANSLVRCLMIASHHMGSDILRISVDTLDYETVMRTYDSLEIPRGEVHPTMVSVDTNAPHFVESTTQAHRKSYQQGLCSVCITNIRSVRDSLDAEGIPCVLLAPSREDYINEIRRLMLYQQAEQLRDATVMVRIRAELSTEYYLHRKTMVQDVLDLDKLSEDIVLFAQLLHGAFIHIGMQDFAIICGFDALSAATEQFSRLDLLAQVYSGTPYRLAVGIGTGTNLQTIQANAELGTQRAWVEGCNRAYLVYGPDHIVGPIQPNELLHARQSLFDSNLTKAAQDCALSIHTISRIDTFVRRKNNGSFITADLARELHVSFRTAARIVEKLEANGYAIEIGRSAINGRGRPTRIFRLLW